MELGKLRFLSGNALKIIAAATMFVDHFGLLFFPENMLFRIIGRLSYPIFAYLLAEGCRYTRNKFKHFLTLFALAVICQLVYYFFAGDTYLSVLVTLSLSEVCIFALQFFKSTAFDENAKQTKKLLSALPFLFAVGGVALLTNFVAIDYGFWGCMLPVFVALFDFRNVNAPEKLKKLDNAFSRYICFAIGLTVMVVASTTVLPKYYAFFALIPIGLYSGERGKRNMKYFFYLFYPLHLVLLEGLYMLVYFF